MAQTLTTRYIHPSNFRGARISVAASGGLRKMFPVDQRAQCPHVAAVRLFLSGLGWRGNYAIGETKDGGRVFVAIDPAEQITA